MTPLDPTLARLAERHGVATRYRDIRDETQVVAAETIRAALHAMGVDTTGDSAEIAQRRPLPAVWVRREDEPLALPLLWPAGREGRRLWWVLRLENGERQEHSFVPRDIATDSSELIGGTPYARRLLGPGPGRLAPGYHGVELYDEKGAVATTKLIVAPRRAFIPHGLAGDRRVWGPAVQLYALRGEDDWGIGDFTRLAALAQGCRETGAGVIGLSPLHALFSSNPTHIAPYSPSSRVFLQWIYLDVESIPELSECRQARERVDSSVFRSRLRTLRDEELIDHTGVAAVKRELLEMLWDHFRRTHLSVDSPRARIFRRFVIARGELLTAFATFEALDERFRTEGCAGWPNWPAEYRRPQSAAVTRFADERADRLGFFEWIQWECDRQLGRVGQACAAGSLPVGLYQDLAVGVDGSGFESWYWQDVFARDVTVGAPPDDFNLLGQDWGLLPWIPEKLRETGYQPFIDCLRSNMRYAGALRIDHVMGLMRTFWVPNGMQARDGTYVAYPFHDLLGVLALESQRNRCMVIGEDLGTVPDEVRRELAPVSVLSTRLLWFTREADGRFSPPADYPRQSVVATSTHDLPTLAGWWGGDDIRLRTELGLFAEDTQGDRQIAERARDRGLLLEALRDHGLLPEGIDPAEPPDQLTVGLTAAVHRFLARGPAMLALFQFEDVLGQTAQANLPGTTDQHPNWRRRLSVAVEGLADDERVRAVSEALQMERG